MGRRNPCTDARRSETCVTPTCVAPRHVDASLDFNFNFLPNKQRGGGALPDFFFILFFPCSADHERDWPPCKVVVFGLAANALNVRNSNNNNTTREKRVVAFKEKSERA